MRLAVRLLMVCASWFFGCVAHAESDFDIALKMLLAGRCDDVVEPLNLGIKAGDPKAFNLLGAMHHKGVCVKADPPRAIPYLELAAKAGEARASGQLILIHGFGRGVPQNYAEAGRWAVAVSDIVALEKLEQADKPHRDKGSKILDPMDTAALGFVASVHYRADELLERNRLALDRSIFASFVVTVRTPGPTLEIVTTQIDDRKSNFGVERPRKAKPMRELVEAAYLQAISEVPPLASMVGKGSKREYVFEVK
jgi:Sel1 repeat